MEALDIFGRHMWNKRVIVWLIQQNVQQYIVVFHLGEQSKVWNKLKCESAVQQRKIHVWEFPPNI